MKKLLFIIISLCAFYFSTGIINSYGQAGTLDLTFGSGGFAITDKHRSASGP
jgi:hypothetical protein